MQVEIVSQITEEIYSAFGLLIPQLNPTVALPTREDLETILSSGYATLLIIRNRENQISGSLTLVTFHTPTGTHAWIEDVIVNESERGHGCGEALTRTAIALAKEKGAKAVDLTSRPERVAANRLYQRLGFQLRQSNLYRYDLQH